jgi:Nuclear pore protein 84 / 107
MSVGADYVRRHESDPQNVALLRQLKDKVRDSLEYLDCCFDPFYEQTLVHGARGGKNLTSFLPHFCMMLTSYSLETEEAELEFIRHTYLPELILNYHHAILYAGRIFEDVVTQCLMLSSAVAGNPILIDSFMGSGRMRELVDSLALSSSTLVNISGVPRKGKRRPEEGATLDIWDVKLEKPDETPTPL